MTSIISIPRITRRAGKVWFRNLEVFFRTWKVNFFPPFIEALLYLFAIGLGIGSYVNRSRVCRTLISLHPRSLPWR